MQRLPRPCPWDPAEPSLSAIPTRLMWRLDNIPDVTYVSGIPTLYALLIAAEIALMPIHVVICDNQPDVTRMISCRLMRADFEVHSAHDAESAWDVVQRVGPQLLITHLQPGGVELVHRIRRDTELCDLPVVGLSTAFGASTQSLRQELQLEALLQKPFSLRRLVALAEDITRPIVPAA